MLKRLLRSKKGAALVEYGLLVAGVALVAAAAVSVFGHKTNELISGIAAVLPGTHQNDNAPIAAGQLIEVTPASDNRPITIDTQAIFGHSKQKRLGENLDIPIDVLIIEPAFGNN